MSASGTCRIANGAQWAVVLEDLTTDGCRIADPQCGLTKGQRVQITVEQGAAQRAEVCWWRKGEAGLAFAQPLSEQLLKSLRENPESASGTARTVSPARYC